jgi:hypothetical protein
VVVTDCNTKGEMRGRHDRRELPHSRPQRAPAASTPGCCEALLGTGIERVSVGRVVQPSHLRWPSHRGGCRTGWQARSGSG